MNSTKTTIPASEYDRAEWPETSQVHVSEPDNFGYVTVTEVTGSNPDWVEGCSYCAGEKPGGFFPRHSNTNSRCGGNGGTHCTCDSCF